MKKQPWIKYCITLVVVIILTGVFSFVPSCGGGSGEAPLNAGLLWGITSNPSIGFDKATAVAVDSSGLYVVGYEQNPGMAGDVQWRVEKRSLSNGSLIGTFGTGGVVTENPSIGDDEAAAVAVDSSGLYVVGYEQSPGMAGDVQWRIEKRSLSNGALIATFGAGGVVTSNPSSGDDEATAVAVDSSGLYVVGYEQNPSMAGDVQWLIEKLVK